MFENTVVLEKEEYKKLIEDSNTLAVIKTILESSKYVAAVEIADILHTEVGINAKDQFYTKAR